jgi:hypothetical protein
VFTDAGSEHIFMQTGLIAAISAILGAAITGIYALWVKRNEYVNDYYKTVIARRIAAYEQLETIISSLKTSVVDDDNRPYHLLFASDDYERWEGAFVVLHGSMSRDLWLSNEMFAKLRELNLLMFRFKKPKSVIEFGKENYEQVASIRAEIERLLAKDMLTLYDVRKFLKSKDRPDQGFQPTHLK